MPNTTIQLKKSSTPSAKPADLANGELAINFADGKLYYKNTTSSIVEITPTQSSSFGTVSANGTLLVADTVGDILTINPGTNISIVGDAVNDRLTINLASDVVIPSTGTFKVATVGGDEGGEIKLGNAVTNSGITGDIVIDVWQNHIRFFESGGTNRGAFINLALTGTSVGTNLLAIGTGTQGIQGIQGRQGANGFQGLQGTTGTQGANGFQGLQGTTGTQGANGFQGLQGTTGTQGANGFQGLQGTTGTQGANGFQGLQGTTGTQGANGFQGIQGTTGTQGANGFQGIQGTQGRQGANGFQGIQGTTGTQGANGFQGLQGTTGTQGANGFQGITGTGIQGANGFQGIQGPSSGGGATVSVSDVAPSTPIANSLWWNSTTAKMYIYYNDGDTSQWVEANQYKATQGIQGTQSIQGLQGFQGASGAGGVTTFSAGTTGFTPASATAGAVTLAGTLAVASGGTNGSNTPTAGAVAYGAGSSYAFTNVGTAGQALVSNASSAPTFSTLTLENLPGAWPKKSVRVATTTALTVTATSSTLTNAGALAALSIDGVSLAVNDRVLVKDQANTFQNGIYTTTDIGSGAVAWILTRSADADTADEIAGGVVNVDSGTVNDATLWGTTFTPSGIIGGSAMLWYRLFDLGQTLRIANGGTGANTAGAADTALRGFTSTATAGATTTWTSANSLYNIFTGTNNNQTISLPSTATLALGWSFHIVNNSTGTGTLTVNTSAGNQVIVIPPGTTAMVTCINTGSNAASAWEAGLTDFSTYTGIGNLVLASSPTITSPIVSTPNLTITSATTSSPVQVVKVEATSSGTPAAGFGPSIDFVSESAGGTLRTGARIAASMFDATNGSEDFDMRFYLMTAGNAAAETFRIDNSGVPVTFQTTPATFNTTGTITIANMLTRIITSSTAAAVVATLPTGTNMDGGFNSPWTSMAFDWTVINTGPNLFTVQAAASGHTIVGVATVPTTTSATFRSRRTGGTTWVTYRL